ncbi:SAM-dependent methyltransferase [Sphingomonas nostoxanthinifaciens]|uniref:SAM-dependent methyltransferase n=1 Tax=Sphingomonas nostoxanthinifaciens TaxID=2872652 RepID=UPI001CC1E9D3|nr:methyltransferase domain-containing protein [Sphingomonas nostoxanthinifaciens]UAK24989.1 methyltransferase domain-containing protein [Sphingomonas nostoxanthinifaciens]
MDELITDQDREKLLALTSLLNDADQPNTNALNEIVRNINILSLNVKALGYELAQRMAVALPIRTDTTAGPVGLNTCLSTQADIESDWVAHWCGQLRVPVVYHRKMWELAYVLQVLFERGLIQGGVRGLGFGCGAEPVPSYLAARGAMVTVTDLPLEEAAGRGWAETGQHAASLDQAYHPAFLDRACFDQQVDFRAVDMTAIPADLTGYDFCWSLCALEHLGSIEAGLTFIENSLNTLRPGGIAVHTTEFNIDNRGRTIDNWPTVLFQERHLRLLADRLAAKGHCMAPIELDLGRGVLDRFVDLPPYSHDLPAALNHWIGGPTHLKVAVDGFVVTCVGIVVQKAV